METAPAEQDIHDLYLAGLPDLNLLRWNSFLSGDIPTLRGIREEALERAAYPGSDPAFAALAEGCANDINKLENYMGA